MNMLSERDGGRYDYTAIRPGRRKIQMFFVNVDIRLTIYTHIRWVAFMNTTGNYR